MITPRTFFTMVCMALLTLLLCLTVHGDAGYSLDVPASTHEKSYRRKRQGELPIMIPFDFGSDGQYNVEFSTVQFAQLVSCLCEINLLYCSVEVNGENFSDSIGKASGQPSACIFHESEVIVNGHKYSLRMNCRSGLQIRPFNTSDDSSCQFLYDIDESCPLADVNVYLGSASEQRLEIDTDGSRTTVRLCNKANDIIDGGDSLTDHSTSSVIDHSTSSFTDYSTSSVALYSTSATSALTAIATTTVSRATSPNTNYTQTMAPAASQEEEIRVGIIIGVVVGAVVLIAIVVAVIIVWRRNKKNSSATAKKENHADRMSSWQAGHANASSSEHYISVYSVPKQPPSTRLNKSNGYTDVTPDSYMVSNYSTVSPDIENIVKNDPQYSETGEVSLDPKNVYSRLHEKVKDTRNPYDTLAPLEKEPSNLGPSNKIPKGRDDKRDVLKDSDTPDDVSALYATVVKGGKAKNQQNIFELERQDHEQD